jgi:iron complex outermembrane receptor protein
MLVAVFSLNTRSCRTHVLMSGCALSALVAGTTLDQAVAQQPSSTPLPQITVTPAPAPKAQPKRKAPPAPAQAALPPAPGAQLGAYNPALDLPGLTLPPGTTVTTAGPVSGYQALSAMSATKTATPIEQLPQSLQVLPKSLLDDQRPVTVSDALQNVSNAQGVNNLGIGNTDLAPLKIRGFAAEQWLDGMTVNYNAGNRDAFSGIERIEVLKGPNALLYGGGSGSPVGGAVNVISKLPTHVAGGEVGVTVGSFGYYRPYFDINQPLTANGSALFRVTGEYTGAKSFIDILESRRYAINPTLTLTNKEDTTLTIQARFSRFDQQAYAGLPAVGTVSGAFRIDPNLFAGDPKIMPSFTKTEGVTVSLDHRLNSIWSFSLKTRYSRSEFDQNSQGPTTAAPDVGPTTWSLMNIELAQSQEEISVNPNLRARFGLGDTKNTVLVGADYSRVTDKGFMTADVGVLPVDLTNPVFVNPYSRPDASSPFFFPFFNFNGTYTTKGAYAQLQSTISDRVHLLAGARLANIDVSYYERVPYGLGGVLPPETFTVDKTKLLPRAGIVVDVMPWLSVYGSYGEGMRWASFVQAPNLAPEESRQYEAGLKYKFSNTLTGTTAVFDILRSNVPSQTATPGLFELSEQRSKGIETDLVWQPNANWKFLASYGYTNAEYASSTASGAALEGNKLSAVPAHSGRIWAHYAFTSEALKGLSAGAGLYMASGQYVDNANLYKTAGFYTVDAKLAYDKKNYSASLHVKNLTGEHYYVPYAWLGGQVAPGDARAIYGTFALKY